MVENPMFFYVALDEFTVMPNHFHGIARIYKNDVGAKHPGPHIGNALISVTGDASPLQMQQLQKNKKLPNGTVNGSF